MDKVKNKNVSKCNPVTRTHTGRHLTPPAACLASASRCQKDQAFNFRLQINVYKVTMLFLVTELFKRNRSKETTV